MKRVITALVVLVFFAGLFAYAGDNPQANVKIAKYIIVQHVVIAEGKAPAYPGLLAQYRHAADAIKSESYWLGASYMTGDLRQATFVIPYPSFEMLEKSMKGMEKIYAEASRTNPNFAMETSLSELSPRGTIAKYREDLSYRPLAVPLPDAKYWMITSIHIAPGYRTQFADLVKEEIALLEKAKIEEHFVAYEVMAGLPTTGSSYFFVTNLKSLADLDIDRSEQANAIFTPLVRAHFDSAVQKMVVGIEDNILQVRPEFSRPPATFLAANPDFWTVKEPPPVVAKTKGKKPIAVEAGNVKPKEKPIE